MKYSVYYLDEPAGVWRSFPGPSFPTREEAENAFEAHVAKFHGEFYTAWKAGNWQVVEEKA
jgi:hypothetical protein